MKPRDGGRAAESARPLTGAAGSGIRTMDASGRLEDFVTAGVSPEENQRFLELPYGPALRKHLREVPGPLRLGNLAVHLSALGFPPDGMLARSFLGVPDPSPGRACRQLLPGRQGGWRGVPALNSRASPCRILTPLEELERLPAEFLGMVSHELQAPLTSIKGSAATVLGAMRALDPAETMQFFRIINEQRIVQLLGNLLSNAARHSPPSAPIRVAAAREGVHVEVSVADEGRSIPAERLHPPVPQVCAERPGTRERARPRASPSRFRSPGKTTGRASWSWTTIPPRCSTCAWILEDASYCAIATAKPEEVPGLIERYRNVRVGTIGCGTRILALPSPPQPYRLFEPARHSGRWDPAGNRLGGDAFGRRPGACRSSSGRPGFGGGFRRSPVPIRACPVHFEGGRTARA